MGMNDTIAANLSNMLNHEKTGKNEVEIRFNSKIFRLILDILNENGYIGSYEQIENGKGGNLKINLIGKINNCGSIKPRFPIKVSDFTRFEKRFLPASNFGLLIVSTNKGLMTHEQAKELNVGGKLIAFIY